MKKVILAISIIMVISGCGRNTAKIDMGVFTEQNVCVAAIATIMDKQAFIIKLSSIHQDFTELRYTRALDDSLWRFRCKLDDNEVIWSSIRQSGSYGRWRTDETDANVTFNIKGSNITISEIYSDGSVNTNTYQQGELSGK